MEYDNEDYENEEETETMILHFNEEGKLDVLNENDYVSVLKKDMKNISDFIAENIELFNKFIEKRK